MKCFPSYSLFHRRAHGGGPCYELPSLLQAPNSRDLEVCQNPEAPNYSEAPSSAAVQCPQVVQANAQDDILAKVPALAVDPAVREYVTNGGGNLSKVVGPTIPWLQAAALGSLVVHVVFYFLVTITVKCSSESATDAWLVWGPVVLFGAFCLWVEWICVRHTALLLVAIGGQFQVFTCNVIFWVWLLFNMTSSALSLADMSFDSRFTAITQRTLSCDDSLAAAWRVQWSQSFLGYLKIPPPSLNLYVLGSWLLVLAQVVWCVIVEVTFLIRQKIGSAPQIKYEVGHAVKWSATINLAEASGLASMQKLAVVFPLAMQSFSPHPWTDLNYLDASWDLLGARILISFIGENCVQLDLQTTLLGLNRRSSADYQGSSSAVIQAVTSITLSIIATALKFSEIKSFLDLAAKAQSRIKDAGWLQGNDLVDSVMQRDLSEINLAKRWNHDVDWMLRVSKARWRKLRRAVWMARGGAAVMAISLLSTSIRLVASHFCSEFAFNLYNGCVVF